MAVARVGVERDVQDDADIETGFLDGTRGAADKIFGIDGFSRVVAPEFRICEGEKCECWNSEPHGFVRGFNCLINTQAVDSGER